MDICAIIRLRLGKSYERLLKGKVKERRKEQKAKREAAGVAEPEGAAITGILGGDGEEAHEDGPSNNHVDDYCLGEEPPEVP